MSKSTLSAGGLFVQRHQYNTEVTKESILAVQEQLTVHTGMSKYITSIASPKAHGCTCVCTLKTQSVFMPAEQHRWNRSGIEGADTEGDAGC